MLYQAEIKISYFNILSEISYTNKKNFNNIDEKKCI